MLTSMKQQIKFDTQKSVIITLAAAGAGKTTAAMADMEKMIKIYRPDEIAFVTYTKKGVAEGMARAVQVNSELTVDDLLYFRTLHSLCFREAGIMRKSIITAKDIQKFNAAFGFSLSSSEAFGYTSEDDKMLQRYDSIRAGSEEGVFIHSKYNELRYTRLINAYESFKKGHGLVDFYDCLLRYMEAGKPLEGVKVAYIDESQDLSLLQWRVCEKAFSAADHIRIMGDDYQSLFKYSGAAPEILIDLSKRYETVKLETSYRLPRAVYEFSRGITNLMKQKVDKDYVPATDEQGFVTFDIDRAVLVRKIRDDLDTNGYKAGRWYVLFRTNCHIASFISLLEQFIIPYHDSRGFCINVRDLTKLSRYYKFKVDGYGAPETRDNFMQKYGIESFDNDFTDSNLIPGVERYYYLDLVNKYGIKNLEEMAKSDPFLLLSTVHKVKGGEADYTAFVLDSTKLVTDNMLLNIDEELRVLYVGCTRSRKGLYIVPSKTTHGLDKLVNLVRNTI